MESEDDRIRRLYSQVDVSHILVLFFANDFRTQRDLKALLFQNIIPIVALLGGLLIIKYVVHYDYPSVTLGSQLEQKHKDAREEDITDCLATEQCDIWY